MGKAGKWLRSFLTGKKDEKKEKASSSRSPLSTVTQSGAVSVAAHKEKKRWSFWRSTAAGRSSNSSELSIRALVQGVAAEAEVEQIRQAMAVAVATAAAADAAGAAAQAAAAVLRLTTAATQERATAVEEAAATRIQSAFRGFLARKALCALRGLVMLQALVRGRLVRKQAAAALRCMQALVTAQERARVQRTRMAEEHHVILQRHSIHRRSPQHPRSRQSQVSPTQHSYGRRRHPNNATQNPTLHAGHGQKCRGQHQNCRDGSRRIERPNKEQNQLLHRTYGTERTLSGCHYGHSRTPSKAEQYPQLSPAPSALTANSPRASSGHFERFSFVTAQRSPLLVSAISAPDPTHSCDNPFFPSYMADTESSRAKARSQSVPRQRIESTYEQQTSRRRASMEGRSIPRGVKTQRSSSQVALTINGHQYPWSIKLDKSSMSLKDSEYGSTSTVLINTNYCKSLVPGNKN